MDDTNKPKLDPEQQVDSFDTEPPTNTEYTMPDPISQSTPDESVPAETPVASPVTPTSTPSPAAVSVSEPAAAPAVDIAATPASETTAPAPVATTPLAVPTEAVVPVVATTTSLAGDPAAPTPPKKSKKGILIGGIIAIVAVLLFGGAALAYNFWYQNPDKVITDAIINASKAKSVVFNGVIDVTGDQKVKVTFDGNTIDKNGQINIKATFTTSGKEVTIEGSGLVDKDNNIYIKVKDAKKLITEALGTYASAFDDIIAKIDNKWVKITTDDLSEYSTEARDAKKCVDEAYAKFKDDKAAINEVTDVFQKNRFIVVSKQLPSQNGSLGYEITVDESKTESFAKAFMETKIYKQLHECDSETFTDTYTPPTSTPEDKNSTPDPTVQLWVSRFGHEITKVTSDLDHDGTKTHFDLQTVFNKQVPVNAPTEFVTIDELKNDIEALFSSPSPEYEIDYADDLPADPNDY